MTPDKDAASDEYLLGYIVQGFSYILGYHDSSPLDSDGLVSGAERYAYYMVKDRWHRPRKSEHGWTKKTSPS